MSTPIGGASQTSSRSLAQIRWSAALGALVIGLNLTVMNVAVADLRSSFPDASFSSIGWVVSAYTIVFGAVLVPAGRLADRLGRRSVFMTGLATFATGSILAGLAPALWVLIAARAVQGVGAACITPASMAILLDASPVSERAAATSFYSGVSAVGAAGGPSVGALLIDVTNWRFAFLLGLPFLATSYALGRRTLPASVPMRDARLPDLVGAVMLMVAMTGVSLGIVEGRSWGWTDARVLTAFAVSAALIPVFVRRCNRHPSPVMAMGLFRRPSFAGANVAAVLFGVVIAGASLINILFLRDIWGYSLVSSGLGALPGPIVATFAARTIGRLGVRYGEAAVSVPGALTLLGALSWLRVMAHEDANYWIGFFPGSLMLGLGVASVFPMIGAAAVRGIDTDELSLASATNRTFFQLGNAIGLAAVVAVLTTTSQIGTLSDFRFAWVMLGAFAVGCLIAVAATGSTRHAASGHDD